MPVYLAHVLVSFVLSLFLSSSSTPQDEEPPAPPATGGKGATMDYGPFYSSSVTAPRGKKGGQLLAGKALTVKVGKSSAVCYDSETMRMVGTWSGGFLDLSQTHMTSGKGSQPTAAPQPIRFGCRSVPSGDPSVKTHYRGLYLYGNRVVLSYSVGDCDILEMPGLESIAGETVLTRSFQIGKSSSPVTLGIVDEEGAKGTAKGLVATLDGAQNTTSSGIAKLPAGVIWCATGSRLELKVASHPAPINFIVAIVSESKGQSSKLPEILRSLAEPPNLSDSIKGGPSRWPAPVITKGRRGNDDGAYTVDTLALPEPNPWNSWMRPGALDFFSDGRCAVSTWNGDVWIVSGIDDALEKVAWRRFATGLYEPLGLRIVEDKVYVLGRDRITRLHDLDGDGEADFYENFNSQSSLVQIYHAFAFDLQTDREGNLYYVRDGHRVDASVPHHGSVLKVSRDGKTLDIFATGFRAANGMCVGPNDEVTAADNQGNWIPTSKISWVRQGGFYGYVPHSGGRGQPKEFDQPLCWIPYGLDNSSGGQVWATSDRWGPLQSHLLHLSYGKSSLFTVLTQDVGGGVMQGGVVKLPLTFDTGIMRGRFNPRDGQLYVCGLRGWQTSGAKDGGLHRVRYTGKPFSLPVSMEATKAGFKLTFSRALDPETATADSFAAEQWSYKWSGAYGSPEFSAAQPEKRGRDPVTIAGAKLTPDGKSVILEIPGLKPVMQLRIQFRLKTADGAPISSELHCTLHRIP